MAGTMSTDERAADLAANKQAVAEVSDADLYSAAVADEQPEASVEEVKTEPKADATGRLHAPDGKFAPKATTDAAPTQQQPTVAAEPETARDEAVLPSWRAKEIREARDAAERRAQETAEENRATRMQLHTLQQELAELKKPKAEPIDFFADPNAAIAQSLTPIEQRFQTLSSQLTLRASRAENVVAHGKDVIAEMEKTVKAAMMDGHPEMAALGQRMRNSDDPVGEALQWYQRDKLQKETGGDLTAYRQKLLDEAMKDPAFQAKVLESARAQAGQNGSTSKVVLPPSLSKVASAARVTGEDDGDLSDASLYRHALR